MEYPVQVLVVFLVSIIALLIIVVLAHQWSGDTRDLGTWLMDRIKGMTGFDFGPNPEDLGNSGQENNPE